MTPTAIPQHTARSANEELSGYRSLVVNNTWIEEMERLTGRRMAYERSVMSRETLLIQRCRCCREDIVCSLSELLNDDWEAQVVADRMDRVYYAHRCRERPGDPAEHPAMKAERMLQRYEREWMMLSERIDELRKLVR